MAIRASSLPLALSFLVAAACSSPVPVAETPPRPTAGYFKLDLSRATAAGTVQVDGFSRVETSARPLAAGFEYLAVAFAADEVVTAMPFGFPTSGVREWMDSEGRYLRAQTIALESSSTSVMLPDEPGITRIDVLDAAGTTIASLDPAAAEQTAAVAPSLLIRSAYAAESTMLGHIEVLTELEQLPSEFWYIEADVSQVETLHALTTAERNLLQNALAQLPPKLHGAIARISIASYQNDGCDTPGPCDDSWVGGDAYGNAIILNRRLLGADSGLLLGTLAHEAVHCFHALVDQSNDLQFDDDYNTVNVLPAAVQAAENARGRLMHGSINRVLEHLQKSSKIAYDGYKYYAGDAWAATYGSDADAVRDAFATPYGSEEAREDLAELVKIFVTGEFSSHPYCTQFAGLNHEIPPDKALAFAKLNFARGIEVLDEALYTQCVGSADPVDGEMIAMGSRKYMDQLSVGLQKVKHENLDYDWVLLRIQGVTDDAQLEIRARVRKDDAAAIGTPVGFYEMDRAGAYGLAADRLIPIAAQNVITFQRTDTSNSTELAAYTRISGGGFLLITDFNDDLVKGYVFFVPFHNIIELQPPATDVLDVIWFQIEDP